MAHISSDTLNTLCSADTEQRGVVVQPEWADREFRSRSLEVSVSMVICLTFLLFEKSSDLHSYSPLWKGGWGALGSSPRRFSSSVLGSYGYFVQWVSWVVYCLTICQ